MRELKIRIWDNLFKEFKALDNYFCKAKDGILTVCTNNDDIMLDLPTGLKDKNGKEIYAGDIVKYAWTNCNYVVVYRRYDVSFGLENDCREEIFLLQRSQQKDYEVIGNIHENPELLESEQ